jgi:murein DD-endopeptidase MepM/ murein hydrolase activator NlpD
MMQRQKSAQKNLYYSRPKGLTSKRFASTLPAQGICWLSSVSLLSGGLVFAQEAVDNIVPTIETSQPATQAKSVREESTIAQTEQAHKEKAHKEEHTEKHTEYAERRIKLRNKLHQQVAQTPEATAETAKHRLDQAAPEALPRVIFSGHKSLRHKVASDETSPTVRISTHKAEKSPSVSREKVSRHPDEKLAAEPAQSAKTPAENSSITFEAPSSNISKTKTEETDQPKNQSQETVGRSTKSQPDYKNAYIDPTNYSTSVKKQYQAPDSVVVNERASGCYRTITKGQSISGNTCTKPNKTHPVATAHHKTVPNWLAKSAHANLVHLAVSSPENQETDSTYPQYHHASWQNSIQASQENQASPPVQEPPETHQSDRHWPISQTGSHRITKTAYHLNRFMPSASEFVPTTETASTNSTTSTLGTVGTLPTPAIEGNAIPRPSIVSYNFNLASVLPKVSYTGTIAYQTGSGLLYPLSIPAPVTSLFGWRIHPITGDRRFHAGTDLGAPMGTPILAAARGQVETANWIGGYGLAVIINHNSAEQTLYGHMSQIFVHPGQWVEPGTVIGQVGSTGNSTGPHLHFEVRHLTQDGWVAVDPGTQLQVALDQLVQTLHTAQVPREPRS